MALGTKIGVGLAVVVIGGAGLLFSNRSKSTPKPSDDTSGITASESPGAAHPVAEPAPEPLRTTPPADVAQVNTPPEPAITEHSGSVASPPAAAVVDVGERSFRAKPETPAESTPRPDAMADTKVIVPQLEPPPPAVEHTAITPAVVAPAPEQAMTHEAPKTDAVVAGAAASATSKPAVASAKPTQHVIQAGDTYSSLAEKYLGNAKYANLITKANPGKDPRKLFVGAKINIPAAPKQESVLASATSKDSAAAGSNKSSRVATDAAPAIAPDRAYKVQPNESWNDLAQRFLGDGKRWPELYEFNKDRVPKNPQSLKSGTVIELPPGVKLTTKPS